MPAKAVLFDLFSTLLLLGNVEDYYPSSLRRLHGFLIKNGVNVSFEDFEQTYFEVRDRILEESLGTLEEPHFNLRISQTLSQLGHSLGVSDPIVVGATRTFSEEFMNHVSLDIDAPDVLQELGRKHKLGLVSNFAIPECARELLERFGLKGFFDAVVISGEVNRRKPSPKVFEMALKVLGVSATEAVFVGDSLEMDVVGPKNIGMKTIYVKRGPAGEESHVKPDATITRLNELLVAIKRL